MPAAPSPSGVPIDRAQKRRHRRVHRSRWRTGSSETAQQGALLRGEAVFNYGVYFIYRNQLLQARAERHHRRASARYVRLNQKQYVPDLWLQLLWEGLRVELEATFVAGTLEGGCPQLRGVRRHLAARSATSKSSTRSARAASRSGSASFASSAWRSSPSTACSTSVSACTWPPAGASGDSNAYGLAATNDPSAAACPGRRGGRPHDLDLRVPPGLSRRPDPVAHHHAARRRRVLLKPGVSYDFIHDPYGQLAGGRVDVIYSRATSASQTWGQTANLGLELDLSLYYRSEDGPDPMDGFYGLVQWGMLFPFQGLNYDFSGAPGKKNAMVLRGVAGIAF